MKIQMLNIEASRGELKEIKTMIREFRKADHRDKKSTQVPKADHRDKSTQVPKADHRDKSTQPKVDSQQATKEEICEAWKQLTRLMGIA